jgi:hypothetical protein
MGRRLPEKVKMLRQNDSRNDFKRLFRNRFGNSSPQPSDILSAIADLLGCVTTHPT